MGEPEHDAVPFCAKSDLVERLRQERPQFYESTMKEAAYEIERLRGEAGYLTDGIIPTLKAEIERLRAALREVHCRTGLLLYQNTGRWDAKLEHDVRTINVLQGNQEIAFKALEGAEMSDLVQTRRLGGEEMRC